MQEGLRCCPIPCCVCSIYPCQAHSLDTCCVLSIQGIKERRRTALVPIPRTMPFYNHIKSSIVISDRLSCYGSRHLNERKDFGIKSSVVSVSNNCFSIHPDSFLQSAQDSCLIMCPQIPFHVLPVPWRPNLFWSLPHPLPLTIHPWIRQHELGKINYFVKWSLFLGSGFRAAEFFGYASICFPVWIRSPTLALHSLLEEY